MAGALQGTLEPAWPPQVHFSVVDWYDGHGQRPFPHFTPKIPSFSQSRIGEVR